MTNEQIAERIAIALEQARVVAWLERPTAIIARILTESASGEGDGWSVAERVKRAGDAVVQAYREDLAEVTALLARAYPFVLGAGDPLWKEINALLLAARRPVSGTGWTGVCTTCGKQLPLLGTWTVPGTDCEGHATK